MEGICGATQRLTPTKALIQLSLRYKTGDQLWFTFFHEAGHILLHSTLAQRTTQCPVPGKTSAY